MTRTIPDDFGRQLLLYLALAALVLSPWLV